MQNFEKRTGLENDWQQQKRRTIEKFFVPENCMAGSHKEFRSPSDKYLLSVEKYSTGPHTWQYSRGVVTRISDGTVIADVKRNYGHFWHAWVQHTNGNEYMLCGEDYQDYTIVDLARADIRASLPDSAQNGGAFCWGAVYPSTGGTVLAVEGCMWGGPYDLVFYDFSEPFNLPLPEIGRIAEIGKVIGWESDSVFAVEHEFTVRKCDGRRFELLSESEQDEYYQNESAFAYQTEVLRWNRLTRSLVG